MTACPNACKGPALPNQRPREASLALRRLRPHLRVIELWRLVFRRLGPWAGWNRRGDQWLGTRGARVSLQRFFLDRVRERRTGASLLHRRRNVAAPRRFMVSPAGKPVRLRRWMEQMMVAAIVTPRK